MTDAEREGLLFLLDLTARGPRLVLADPAALAAAIRKEAGL